MEALTEKRKTLGESCLEEANTYNNITPNYEEISHDISMKTYEKDVETAIKIGMKKFPGDFYIETNTIFQSTPLGPQATRIPIARRTAPTPRCDVAAHLYRRESGELEPIFMVPDRITTFCFYYYRHLVEPKDYPVLQNVIAYIEGDILRMVKRLNGEDECNSILVNQA